MNMTNPAFEAWKQKAKSVPIESEIARRGITLKGNGAEREGPCPKCGGRDRFSINVKEQAWNCRGCKTKKNTGDVIGLVQWLDGCNFVQAVEVLAGEPAPKANGHAAPPTAKANSKDVVVERYDYQDESGKLLSQAERVERQNHDGSFVLVENGKRQKTFRQRRPDPERPGWIWNVTGVRVVPYHLPELLEAVGNGQTVLIAEGEAKVDRLFEWGLPATCNAGGAEKWNEAHAAFLNGADVVILPDNDAPGGRHAEAVAASLQSIAARVRVLELPGLPPKGDIVDWADAGGTREQLDTLIEEAPDWQPNRHQEAPEPPPVAAEDYGTEPAPSEEAPAPAALITPADWPNEEPPPVDWLAFQRIPRGDVTTLHGDGGAGKTDIALRLGANVSRGAQDWLGCEIAAGSVVVISGEEPEREVRRRIWLHAQRDGYLPESLTNLHLWFPDDTAGAVLATPDRNGVMQPTPLFRSIEAAIRLVAPVLVIVDNVASTFAGNQNDRVNVRSYVNLFRTVARHPSSPAVLLLDHPSLSGLTTGTGRGGNMDWRNAVRSALYLYPPEDRAERDRGIRILETAKSNYGPSGTATQRRLQWVDGGLQLEHAPSSLHRIAKDAECDETFLRMLDERNAQGRHVSERKSSTYAPAIFAELEGNGGFTSQAFARAMERLFQAGKIVLHEFGPPSKRRSRIERAVTRPLREAAE
jgi:RecA-family ATPase